jgi:uncharacterized membrane protein HdeD (DUF308 family)
MLDHEQRAPEYFVPTCDIGAWAMTTATLDDPTATRSPYPWWLLLILGIAWLIIGFLVLSFNFTTIAAIAYFAGFALIAIGISEIVLAFIVPGWRWLRIIYGLLAIAAGVIALAWPGKTFLVLAGILAWYLLFAGIFRIIGAFIDHGEYDLWWLSLIVGLLEIGIAFWAIGYPGRSITLLIVWVAVAAISAGISNIFLAFHLKDLTGGGGPTPALA